MARSACARPCRPPAAGACEPAAAGLAVGLPRELQAKMATDSVAHYGSICKQAAINTQSNIYATQRPTQRTYTHIS
eukprot:5842814-Heterocapsa_arctica.AAC.1